ncbi:MAG: glycosyltransferase [Patescibacteria group bacterium]
MMPKKILIITPRFPLPDTGACEKDRFEGIKQFKRLGFDVRVVSKVFSFQDKKDIEKFSADFGIPVKLLEYENKFSLRKFFNPFYWDGAAHEYSGKSTQEAVEAILDEWHPDLVWFDYTYLWPLYGLAGRRKIPIITRSINFEPDHFLQEDGYSLLNLIKFLPKLASEIITIYKSDFLFAITPNEEKIYRRLGAKNIKTLPLRGLSLCFNSIHGVNNKDILNVFFMGSTYNVHHNRAALEFILKKIAPEARKKYPLKFKFYILGSKVPEDLTKFFGEDIIYVGHKNHEALDEFLAGMDIAIVPSLFGAGMQQKIFEPLCRGIPAVASLRGLAGYPFEHRKHLLAAETLGEFPDLLSELRDAGLRRSLSENSVALSKKLFSSQASDSGILKALNQVWRH